MWNKIKETVKYNKVLMFFTILFAVIIGFPLVTIAILIPYNFIAINLLMPLGFSYVQAGWTINAVVLVTFLGYISHLIVKFNKEQFIRSFKMARTKKRMNTYRSK